MRQLYSVIALETIAIIVLAYFLFKQPAVLVPVVYFDKEYERKMDSADNVIKDQNKIIERLKAREVKWDTIRIGNFNNIKTEHEKVNHFNDTTRNAFWIEYFSTKGIYK